MSGFAGNGPSGAGRLSRYQFTLVAGQIVASGKDDNSLTLRMALGMESVYYRGKKLPPTDYTATSSSITLPGGAAAGDVLEIYAPEVQTNANTFDKTQNGADIADKAAFAFNVGISRPNILINSDFRINQRVYVSGTNLAAGAYAHDRWKAGAGGATYAFAQLASSTAITITAGTIMQVVEDKNVEGGTYILSWTGTAQARAGVNSSTPSGAYAVSPLIINGQAAGTVMSVEFNTGTLGKVKLELGNVSTAFVMRGIETEIEDCERYYRKSYELNTAPGTATSAGTVGGGVYITTGAASNAPYTVRFERAMRAVPTVKLWSNFGTSNQFSTYLGGYTNSVATLSVAAGPSSKGFVAANAGNTTDNLFFQYTAEAEL